MPLSSPMRRFDELAWASLLWWDRAPSRSPRDGASSESGEDAGTREVIVLKLALRPIGSSIRFRQRRIGAGVIGALSGACRAAACRQAPLRRLDSFSLPLVAHPCRSAVSGHLRLALKVPSAGEFVQPRDTACGNWIPDEQFMRLD